MLLMHNVYLVAVFWFHYLLQLGQINRAWICRNDMFCWICIYGVRTRPGKSVLDHTDRTTITGYHELDHSYLPLRDLDHQAGISG